ncbi:MAG TPA: helix-turn-helix domain-containing protein, partial [Pseudonocardiaceae bacterium]|nr:helix-turn-helix domain-containing protein [Pseudonocardiaceae bacterium]
MTVDADSVSGVSKRRPRDRKKQIADNAAALFAEHGFHKVRMEDIAQASGITDRALYRHYENKHALLAHVVNVGQAAYERALLDGGADSGAVREGVIPDLLRGLAAAALDTRELAVLWAREARYLPPADLAVIRERVASGAARIVDRISDARPDLPRPAAELRARAVLGVLASPSHHRR